MNHPSEWVRFFDENTGRYRYKHKGSGVIRDTLMTIGKVFKGTVKNVAKKTAEKATKTIAEKAGQKVGELAVEKGSKQIEQQMQKLRKQKMALQNAKKKHKYFAKAKTGVSGCKKETCKYFAKPNTKKIRRPC